MSRVYGNQLKECAKCHRLRPHRELDHPGKSGKCKDQVRCALVGPEYDAEIVAMNQSEWGIEFLAACKWCGAYHTPATFRALPPAAIADVAPSKSIDLSTSEVLAKECDCGNRIIRAVKKVLPC